MYERDLQWEKLNSTFDPKVAYGTCESAIAVGVCVLTDATLEYRTEAGTCSGALVPVFNFLLWQLLKNAV